LKSLSVYANTGWRTYEFHVWEHAYFQYTAIGVYINLWSPAAGGVGATYAIAYLYEDASTAQSGNVAISEVTSLWPVSGATCSETATLWAKVDNTGSSASPSDAGVWFYVRGPRVDGYVGSVSVADLQAGWYHWLPFYWTIPSNALGTYTYWAIVWSPTSGYISSWSSSETFTVNCGAVVS
jgi:hypothetical protein